MQLELRHFWMKNFASPLVQGSLPNRFAFMNSLLLLLFVSHKVSTGGLNRHRSKQTTKTDTAPCGFTLL